MVRINVTVVAYSLPGRWHHTCHIKSEASTLFSNGLVQNKKNLLFRIKERFFFKQFKINIIRMLIFFFFSQGKEYFVLEVRVYFMVLVSIPNHPLFKSSFNQKTKKWIKNKIVPLFAFVAEQTTVCPLFSVSLPEVWVLWGDTCFIFILFFWALCQRVCFQLVLILTVNLVTIVQFEQTLFKLNEELREQYYLGSEDMQVSSRHPLFAHEMWTFLGINNPERFSTWAPLNRANGFSYESCRNHQSPLN